MEAIMDTVTKPTENLVREFDQYRVRPLPDQPRRRFFGIRKLADSILAIGQTTAGIVTLVTDDPMFDAQLIDGERRLWACQLAGVKFRAEVRANAGNIKNQFLASIAANFQKQDHDCIEIAHALKKASDDGQTDIQLAKLCGKSTSWVNQHLRLLRLDVKVQNMLVAQEDETDTEVIHEETATEDPALTLSGYDQPSSKRHQKLTFSLASLLTAVKLERQFKLANTITSENMTLVGARRLILSEFNATGSTPRHKRAPSDLRQSLYSLTHQSNDRFGIFLDMPESGLKAVFDSGDDDSKIEIAEMLEYLADNISGLAEVARGQVSARMRLKKNIRIA
jgi:ParB/RepB/Spo0J family partition protein